MKVSWDDHSQYMIIPDLQETPIFDGKNPWVSGVDFPLNQSFEMMIG